MFESSLQQLQELWRLSLNFLTLTTGSYPTLLPQSNTVLLGAPKCLKKILTMLYICLAKCYANMISFRFYWNTWGRYCYPHLQVRKTPTLGSQTTCLQMCNYEQSQDLNSGISSKIFSLTTVHNLSRPKPKKHKNCPPIMNFSSTG